MKYFLLLLSFCGFIAYGQNYNLDSCYAIKNDTARAQCLLKAVEKNYRKDMKGCVPIGLEAYRILENTEHHATLGKITGWVGYLYLELGELDSALFFNKQSLVHRSILKDTSSILNSYNNIASTYSDMNKLDSAHMMYLEALKYIQGSEDTINLITAYKNVARSLDNQSNYKDAIKYKLLTLNLALAKRDSMLIAESYIERGQSYENANRYEEAMEDYDRALKIYVIKGGAIKVMQLDNRRAQAYERQGNLDSARSIYLRVYDFVVEKNIKPGIATLSGNLGAIELADENYERALDYFQTSLKLQRELNNKQGILFMLERIGQALGKKGEYVKSIKFLKEGKILADQMGSVRLKMNLLKILGLHSNESGDFKISSDSYREYLALRDSVQLEDQKEAINSLIAQYEDEKKMLEIENLKSKSAVDSLKFADEKNRADLEIHRQESRNKLVTGGGIALGLLAILFIVIAVNRKKSNKNLAEKNDQISLQNQEINEQKVHLEEVNKEILDSINYAKRIQTAILPPDKLVKSYLNNSFILYQPKDIVAGDFYWMEPRGNKVMFAAADCTGHGVPGAMVSVICNNGLNRSVREYGLDKPGEILDKTREIVIQEFEKSEEEVKDGMDIALCCLEGNVLQYAGANNPLWILRKGNVESEFNDSGKVIYFESEDISLIEFKANKQPIGKFDKPEPYTTHSIELKSGDSFYMFSDGFVDQFGGEKGKKFKAKAFKELLVEINAVSMENQRKTIQTRFETWRGDLEQIDDVCVIGVRV